MDIENALKAHLIEIEREAKTSEDYMNQLIDSDPKMGYAKASGYALARFSILSAQVQAFREVYLK